MRIRVPLALSLIAGVLCCSPFARGVARAAQDEDKPLRLRSELVQLNVVVTDKDDRPVTGLKAEDFTLVEEGRPQEVAFFSQVSNSAVAESTGAARQAGGAPPVATEPGRYIFLILNQHSIGIDSRARLREALLEFLREDLGPNDYLAVIGTRGSLAVFQQASRNRRALEVAISAFLGDSRSVADLASVDQTFSRGLIDLGLDVTGPAEQLQAHNTRNVLRTLLGLAKSVRDLPGQKVAIFVSETLDLGNAEGGNDLYYELHQVIQGARRGGLTLYALSPEGLNSPMPAASERLRAERTPENLTRSMDRQVQGHQGLRELAAATGGSAFLNSNNPRVGLQRILAETETYYVLAYYPSSPGDGKFRSVRVSVRNRPDLTVRTRAGYVAEAAAKKEADLRDRDKQKRIQEALGSLIPVRDLRVAILNPEAAKSADSGKPLARMTVHIDIKGWHLRTAGSERAGSIEVIGFAYDLNNKLVDGFSRTINFKLDEQKYRRVLAGGIPLREEIPLKRPGLYSLRVVVINRDTGEMGSASDWVEVK